MTKKRIDRVLSNLGYGSRKEVKSLTKTGRVTLNGYVVKDSSTHIDVEGDSLEIDGAKIRIVEHIYLMLHKPKGYVSATEDSREETVLDLIPEEYKVFKPFPVGRLDKDTEGLILLTNDGDLAHKLLSPKNSIPKTYEAIVEGEVTELDLEAFNRGITLEDGYKCMPAILEILKWDELRSHVRITIYEGKFHQIKRMFLAVGKQVKYLKRLTIGSLKLDDRLELGDYRELMDEEIEELYKDGNSSRSKA